MSKPVNLNKHRKAKARAEKRAEADANAVRYGQSKADKARDATQAEKAARHLDQHKRDPE
ncbi:MAG: DUF4169 family protein [Rhodobacteraceae bacterium]|nr:DUF4169 family protein [Alphaproteobacteria bacterium]MBT8475709.1 DUF4169 family protein [Alphaproteobacteria bacterium]NNK68253.1 DUF4169 family protein [Paracoccaceae bacterium]